MPPTPLNPTSVRVIDPILSTVVQGYQSNERVGRYLFPSVPVSVAGGQVLTFGKEAFRLYNARRAPGGATKRIEFGYLGAPYALVQDALEAKVPREFLRDAAQVPGIDLAKSAVNLVMDAATLSLENEQARIATNTANYDANHKLTLAGGDKWSADTGKPLNNIGDGIEAVRKSTGKRPNVALLSAQAWTAAKSNPQVTERFKYTQSGPVTVAQFAQLIEVENVAVADSAYADDDDEFQDVWGNNVVLAFAPQKSAGIQQPSYGYTYTMLGNPLVEAPYYDNNTKSWVYGVGYERAAVLTGQLAGFLIQGPK